ncbi:hypothetical protein Q1695_016395 [Nippostrongylus brasiliensis]|nr:hypothetical protein Q1695_016395 [Nippostrongylus brasiliensis]
MNFLLTSIAFFVAVVLSQAGASIKDINLDDCEREEIIQYLAADDDELVAHIKKDLNIQLADDDNLESFLATASGRLYFLARVYRKSVNKHSYIGYEATRNPQFERVGKVQYERFKNCPEVEELSEY